MGSFSIWHWLVVLLVVLLLFGGGSKISGLMGDLAKGIKSFKKNMAEEDKDASMAADSAPPAPGTHPAGSIPGPGAAGTTTAAGTAPHPTGTTASAAGTSRPAA
jgi:sec-independent protein translocase protein TatA